VKIAEFAPVPSAIVTIAVAVNPGWARSIRAAQRRSWNNESSDGSRRRSRYRSRVCATPPSLTSVATRRVRRHPRAQIFVDMKVKMALDLGGEIVAAGTYRLSQPEEPRAQAPHDGSSFGRRNRARIAVVRSQSRASFSTCRRPARVSR
jgi:hypothetical protein